MSHHFLGSTDMQKTKSSKRRQKQGKLKAGLKAGWLALGMATAWGGEARGEVIGHVSVTPTTTIHNAFLYYTNNVTTGDMKSLGTMPAGQTTQLSQTGFLVEEVQGYQAQNGHRPTYMMVGLYDGDTGPGVVVSFPNADPVTSHKQWADIFLARPNPFEDYSEAAVIGYLQSAAPGNDDYGHLWNFLFDFGTSTYTYYGHPCATEYAQQAVLVGFSEASNLGSAMVDVTAVPEPAAWVLLVGAAGAVLFWRRDLLGR
jgi:hypothetical protein